MQDKRKTVGILMLAGCGGLVVGALLPWLTATVLFFGTINVAGTTGDGVITLILGVVGGVLAFVYLSSRRETLLWLVGIAGLAAGAVGAYDASNVSTAISDAGDSLAASVGIGLWLTMASSVVVLVGAVMGISQPRAKSAADVPPTPPPLSRPDVEA